MKAFSTNRLVEAEAICRLMIEASAQDFDALHTLGVVKLRQGDFVQALDWVQRAVAVRPGDAQAQQNLGALLARQGRLEEAASCFSRAIALDPRNADAIANLGLIFQNRGQLDAAAVNYRKAIELNPHHAEAHSRLGGVLKEQKHLPEAIAATRRALALRPNYPEAIAGLYHQLQHGCQWPELPALGATLDRSTQGALARQQKSGEPPFLSVSRSADPARNLLVARGIASDLARRIATLNLRFSAERRRGPRAKLTIGYLSGDYRNHPIGHLVRGLFAGHDRAQVRVFAYSYGADDASDYRRRAVEDSDRFVELRGIGAAEAARRIYEDAVDILVDLTGHTGGNRMDILALKPAPLQINYLGFPGTSGAPFIDYIVADKTVLPPEHLAFYSEQPIWLPHSYQLNDGAQPISARAFKRAEFRLPERGFVFSCFCNTYKIEPASFDIWMRLLKAVPGSVLWLLKSNDLAEQNLRREAERRGIGAERLIFDGKLDKPEHLARLGLADLGLDTFTYNGHTTTSDALWAGLPVVAMKGQHFASRVSAGLLQAIGLPELIAEDTPGYEALALALAQDPQRLTALRQRLARHRQSWPLFDTARALRALESGYRQAWEIFAAGEAPRAIEIADALPSGDAALGDRPGLR